MSLNKIWEKFYDTQIKEQKERFLRFKSIKIHCEFPDAANAFQIRYDE